MYTDTDPGFFYQKETMGTTVMAVKYDEGVIACADTRTSYGSVYVADRAADKIDYVHNHIVCLRSGSAAQSQNSAHKVRYLIDSLVIEQGKLPHVKTAARMFQKLNYEKAL
jgi:20S proteasome subunit beta 1